MQKDALISDRELLRLCTLREVVGSFAHEAVQPLNAIMIAAQVLQLRLAKLPAPEDEKKAICERLELIASQVKRAGDLIHEFRAFDREKDSCEAPVHLHEVIDKVCDKMRQQFTARGLDLIIEPQGQFPPLSEAHSEIAEDVVVHALAHARETVQAMAEQRRESGLPYAGRVMLSAVEADGKLVISLNWSTGQSPQDRVPSESAQPPGLRLASAALAASGGALEIAPQAITITLLP
ncbi:MAG: hypothetical protein FJ118_14700 [Deltaproteobacteria bacterium]|nr:hypothetical protein [Deltaproteobacteria bacterium]